MSQNGFKIDFGGVSRDFREVSRDFGGLGVPLGAFGAQWPSKTRGGIHAPPLFYRFWRPKVAQKACKMELKSIKNGVKNRSTFLFDFSSVSEAFFHDFRKVFGTLNLQK